MILFANGDSHTYGEEVPNKDDTFASLIGKHFDFRVLNRATPGGSNDCILRTSGRHYFSNDYFMLIGWTSWEREEWYHNLHYYQINGTGHRTLPKELHERYCEWVMNSDYSDMVIKSQEWHEKIWMYHKALQAKRIKHLFFNTFTPFLELDTPEDFKPLKHKDWQNCFIDPYTDTYYDYLFKNDFKPNCHFHFGADGHKAWAEYLIKHIEEHKLL